MATTERRVKPHILSTGTSFEIQNHDSPPQWLEPVPTAGANEVHETYCGDSVLGLRQKHETYSLQ